MSIAETLLPEFDLEMANTRKALERVPEDKFDYKAHPKSNTMGWVVSHLVEIVGWAEGTLTTDVWDFQPPGAEPYQTPMLKTREEVLRTFDANVVAVRKALAATPDDAFDKPWSLASGGQVLMTMPRAVVIRAFILSHIIHHRAILTVYMRLNDIPVPALYGPSGDEEWKLG